MATKAQKHKLSRNDLYKILASEHLERVERWGFDPEILTEDAKELLDEEGDRLRGLIERLKSGSEVAA